MARQFDKSRELRRRAEAVIPGGVNSPVRAFRAVGGDPPFITRGQGAHIWDADGNEYIDYVGFLGPADPGPRRARRGRGGDRRRPPRHQLRRLHPFGN